MVNRKRALSSFRRQLGARKGRKRRRSAVATVKIVRPRRRRGIGTTRTKGGILPDKKVVTMRYFFQKTMLAPAIIPATQSFRANGLFDPDFSVGGHQPRGYDQWMALYWNWVVLSAKITVKFSRPFELIPPPANSEAFIAGIKVTENLADTDIDAFDMVERKGASFRYSENNDARAFFKTINMKKAVSTGKFLNIKNLNEEHDYHGTAGVDPVRQLYFMINAVSRDAIDAGEIVISGWIDYRVRLLNPRQVGAS